MYLFARARAHFPINSQLIIPVSFLYELVIKARLLMEEE